MDEVAVSKFKATCLAALNRAVALASRRLKTRHRDPVDRFLLATAQVFDLTLVTEDATLLAQKGVRLLANHNARRSKKATSP